MACTERWSSMSRCESTEASPAAEAGTLGKPPAEKGNRVGGR